jgi:hypothetical protein
MLGFWSALLSAMRGSRPSPAPVSRAMATVLSIVVISDGEVLIELFDGSYKQGCRIGLRHLNELI